MYNISHVSIVVLLFSVGVSYLIYTMSSGKPAMTIANTGLLFVSKITRLSDVCVKASSYVKKVLYITVKNSTDPMLSQQIVNVYSKATMQCKNLDVRLLIKPSEELMKISTNRELDLILYDKELAKDIEGIKDSVVSVRKGYKVESIDLTDGKTLEKSQVPVKKYDYVALGGTFDRLHNGHKILLSQAALRTKKELTVGVTDVNMIQSKKLWELIEPVEKRVKSVLDFLTDINPTIDYNVLPIQDIYGPTKDDPRIQMLVLSEETIKGGVKVNEKRKENGLPVLDTFVIELAEDSKRSDEEEHKVSSSNQRMRLLGTTLRPPVPNPDIPDWPYVIGLTGGIASGKSNIANYLEKKGAHVINCDIVAHELYEPGLPLNITIRQEFGDHVFTETGHVDRKKLGQIVFSDTASLSRLNAVSWPLIMREVGRRVRRVSARVAVLEAAVLLTAGWDKHCHQTWAVIVPKEEAVKRLMERNNLPEDQARQRIDAQPSNMEQVEKANVVFSPYWSYEYTQSQVDRAWDELQSYIDSREK